MPRWTEEQRLAQAERIRTQRPWLHTTGPKTEEGKKRVSFNSYKHGLKSANYLELRHLLYEQSQFIKNLNWLLKISKTGE